MKKSITFLIKLLVAHGFALIVYGVVFSSAAAQAADNGELSVANALLGFFGVLAFVLFNLVLIIQFLHNGGLRRDFWGETKGMTLSIAELARYSLREVLICTAIYAAVQLPYCIFYTAFGYDHVYAIFIDQLFIMDVGFYTLCGGIGFLGLFVSTLFFGAIQLAARTMILRHWDETRLQR